MPGAGADVCFGGECEEVRAGARIGFSDAVVLGNGTYGELNRMARHRRSCDYQEGDTRCHFEAK